MEAELYKEVKISVSFNDAEIELITEAVTNSEYKHEATEFSGFWATYVRVRTVFGEEGKPHFRDLTFRELDKILKCFEWYGARRSGKTLVAQIVTNIFKILQAKNDMQEELNKENVKLDL